MIIKELSGSYVSQFPAEVSMDIFVARQPIFDRNKEVAAYELLFRDSTENIMPAPFDGDKATSFVLSGSFMNLGLDTVSSGKKVFINFTENLLIKQIPTIFPCDKTVIEILEDVNPTDEVIEACIKLKKAGYVIALDDFVFDMESEKLIQVADIIKIDFLANDLEKLAVNIGKIPPSVELLAEKVETWNDYRKGLDLGFNYFQGYFFSRPEIMKGKGFPALNVSLVDLISELNNEEPDFEKVVDIIQKDVSITYKLLALMNSAFFKRSVEIKSIRETLVYLGQEEFRRFISVIIMSNLSQNATKELSVLSCVRARFCELIAEKAGANAQEAFVTGLFSLIDAILGQPMGKILDTLPLGQNIKNALSGKKGELYKIIATVTLFERGDFSTAEKVNNLLSVNFDEIPSIYKKAVEWSNSLNLT